MSQTAHTDTAVSFTAVFTPEAWFNDCAVEVDAQGAREWDCTDFVDAATLDYLRDCAARRGEDLDEQGVLDCDDVFMADPAAPGWVRDWQGPFSIRVTRHGA